MSIKVIKRLDWPEPTTTKDKIPLLFHEPYVDTGFRPCHQPWGAYLLSLFQWHNELMNVWTHVAGLVMVVIYSLVLWYKLPLASDPYMWPLTVGVVTMYLLYLCSAGAHLFQNRSEVAHYTCFMCDYAGIGLYGFGSTMIHYWYCIHEDFIGSYIHKVAIPASVLLAINVCICCSVAKTRYKRPYPFQRRLWQMTSVLAIYVWLNIPVWYRLGVYLQTGDWEPSFYFHLRQMSWFTTGGFFFGSDIPQRFFPGSFDIIGHSHQLFHICIVLTTYYQLRAVDQEITEDTHSIHRLGTPGFFETWGMLAVVMIANFFVVYGFYYFVQERLILEAKERTEKENDLNTEGHDNGSVEGNIYKKQATTKDKPLVLAENILQNGHIGEGLKISEPLRHRAEKKFTPNTYS